MLFSTLSLASTALAADLALYWGQASAGSQQSLGTYCANSPGDIYLISFLSSFGSGNPLTMNIAGYNDFFPGTGLLNAPQLGQQIQQCQSLGKKVLLSMGGAIGQYGFSSPQDAESVAEELWNYFGGGSSAQRPFGSAKIDGFDLDGENNIDAANYVPFVNKLRELYATDASKQYYVSAAPQCPFPDATTGQAVANADLDFLFVQFYNNYCSLTGNNFNLDQWQSFASSSAPNKNIKVYVGLPGSPSAAGSGYATIDEVAAKYPEIASHANFGGFMVWDASQANSNIVNGESFAQGLANLGARAAPESTTAAATTSAAAPVPTSPAAPVTTSSAPVTTVAPVTTAAVPVTTAAVPVETTTSAAAPVEITTSAAAAPVVVTSSPAAAPVVVSSAAAVPAAVVVTSSAAAPVVDTTSAAAAPVVAVSSAAPVVAVSSAPAAAPVETTPAAAVAQTTSAAAGPIIVSLTSAASADEPATTAVPTWGTGASWGDVNNAATQSIQAANTSVTVLPVATSASVGIDGTTWITQFTTITRDTPMSTPATEAANTAGAAVSTGAPAAVTNGDAAAVTNSGAPATNGAAAQVAQTAAALPAAASAAAQGASAPAVPAVTSYVNSTVQSTTTITSEPAKATLSVSDSFDTVTSNGWVYVYETVWETSYTTVYDCCKVQTVLA